MPYLPLQLGLVGIKCTNSCSPSQLNIELLTLMLTILICCQLPSGIDGGARRRHEKERPPNLKKPKSSALTLIYPTRKSRD